MQEGAPWVYSQRMLATLRKARVVRLSLLASLLALLGLALQPCCEALEDMAGTPASELAHVHHGADTAAVSQTGSHGHEGDHSDEGPCCDALGDELVLAKFVSSTGAVDAGKPVLVLLSAFSQLEALPGARPTRVVASLSARHRSSPPLYLFTQRFLI